MQEKPNKNKQQDEAAKRRRTLVGIVILLILGFAVNYFLGDDGQETGQDNSYTAGGTVTPGGTGTPTTALGTDGEQKAPTTPGTGEEQGTPTTPIADGESGTSTMPGTDEEAENSVTQGATTTPEASATPEAPTLAAPPEDSEEDTKKADSEQKDGGQDTVPTNAPEKADEIEILYEFRRDSYLEQHFEKHGAEFDYATKEEYLAGANRVIQSPDALHKTEAEDGDDIYYLEETNEFVVVSTDGYIRTYFRPSAGIDYYNRQ